VLSFFPRACPQIAGTTQLQLFMFRKHNALGRRRVRVLRAFSPPVQENY